MKQFQFLEEHEYYKEKLEHLKFTNYIFESEVSGVIEKGIIVIPTEIGKEIEWEYRGIYAKKNSFKFHYTSEMNKEIPDYGNWFRALIRKAEEVLEKRDKLRKLFVKES